MHDCLVTWKEGRQNLQKTKLARKYPPLKPKLDRIREKTRCWNCEKVGHFSRECTAPKKLEPTTRPSGVAAARPPARPAPP